MKQMDFRIASAARRRLSSIMEDHEAKGTPLVATVYWSRNVSFSWKRGVSISDSEVIGVGYYKKSRLGVLKEQVVEVDGLELFLSGSSRVRVAGKILDFKNENFVLCDPKESEDLTDPAVDSPPGDLRIW
jgi:hypothetical protein